MVGIEEYKAITGLTTYSNYDMKEVDIDIETNGFTHCLLDDREMGYFLRAGYKIEVVEKRNRFHVIYVLCKVTK